MNLQQMFIGQEVTNHYSQVQKFSFKNAANDDVCDYGVSKLVVKSLRDKEKLNEIANYFEMAYGYRYNTKKQRLTRGSASAGGMYPTNFYLLCTLQQKSYVLYYSFVDHRFYNIKYAHISDLQKILNFTPQTNYLLIASHPSASLSRYGLRGYRYSLVDAGEAFAAFANIVPYDMTLANVEHSLLEIQQSIGCGNVFFVCQFTMGRVANYCEKFKTLHKSKIFFPSVEPHPYYGINLSNINSFHNTSINTVQRTIAIKPFLKYLALNKRQEIVTNRHSAANFIKRSVPYAFFRKIIDNMEIYKGLFKPWIFLNFYILVIRINGLESGVYQYQPVRSLLINRYKIDESQLENKLYQACQRQESVKNCSFAIVYCCRSIEKNEDYVRNLIDIGIIDANLYYQGELYHIGSTCIGGFSDSELSQLIGTNEKTLMLHLFGYEDISNHKKQDAAYSMIKQVIK